mmetsp:Transcript_72940/g.131414  ORF Transcript_72940/g.131414 Transcript_72940/m.131414 type:complete len:88 (+) Transcript_72940:3-266(+)
MQAVGGPGPDEVACSACISCCGRAGRWPWALQLLEEMERKKLESNVIAFNAAISGCEVCSQWQRGLALLRDMIEASVKLDPYLPKWP